MGLKEYRAKRDFKKTTEPRGGTASSAGGRYVIQKHDASRLHYDFRLELDGVLKSWAVPKGPSLDPGDKRLAVEVEDHPLEYGNFEGTIPQGEYGGGTVMLWDRGQWFPENDPHEGLAKGSLKFRLAGKRLKGSWALVRIRGRESGGKNNWLLIKHRDNEAAKKFKWNEDRVKSISSGRSMDEIAGGRSRVWKSNRPEKKAVKKKRVSAPAEPRRAAAPAADLNALPGARKAPMPDDFKPQLCHLVDTSPEGDKWIHELKFDGYRLLAFVKNGAVHLITRGNKDWTDKFKPIADALNRLAVDAAIFDGEVCAVRDDGRTDFQALQNAFKEKDTRGLVYFLFDLVYCNGYDLSATPLLHRKKALQQILAGAGKKSTLRYSDHIQGRGHEVFSNACRTHLEGIVSKKIDSAYEQRRSWNWVKVKCSYRQEFVIGGFTEPEGARTDFGALLVGIHDRKSGKLLYAGNVGTGFDAKLLRQLGARMRKLAREKSPFADLARAPHVTWIEPQLVGEVRFSEWTRDGRLRHPSFQGLREDKPAREVVREEREHVLSAPSGRKYMTRKESEAAAQQGATVQGVALTHPDRVVYPEQNITKLELAQYYEQVGPWMVPYVEGRPLSVVRCPQGRGRQCFYQKHVTDSLPDYIRGVKAKKDEEPYIVIDDAKGLVGLVQMGVLEFHPWGSREDDLERADYLTFDLDPGEGVTLKDVVQGALDLREVLAGLKLKSFLKTSGGKGYHVVVPLKPAVEWDRAKSFAHAVAGLVSEHRPNRYILNMNKAKRRGPFQHSGIRSLEFT